MDRKGGIRLAAFVLLVTGTVGLLVNEFAVGLGRAVALAFAGFNVLGLLLLAFAAWVAGKREPGRRPQD